MKKFIKIILIFSLCFTSSFAYSKSNRGLTQNIVLKYFKYEFIPKHRKVFKTGLQQENFENRNLNFLRNRLTPMLDPLQKVYDFSSEKKVPIVYFDPTLPVSFVSEAEISSIPKLDYPRNLKWSLRLDKSKGKVNDMI